MSRLVPGYWLVLATLLSLPSRAHAEDVSADRLVGHWVGHIQTTTDGKPVSEALEMTFQPDGVVQFKAPGTKNQTTLHFAVTGQTIALKPRAKAKAQLTIVVDYLSPDELSGILRYAKHARTKDALPPIRLVLKRAR